ncbi:MAG: hypothetical protein IKE76_04025 [Clostridia bacterium]|nr:hypothetical protein [Clostridia bacterium]
MNPLQEALRVEGLERGYSFPSVSFSPLPEPRVIITKVTGRTYNLEVSDYFRDLPDRLAREYAATVMDCITGGLPTVPEEVRRHIREHSLEKYIRRRGYLEPREIREADLEGIANALKDSGKLPRDITVLWTDDPKSSHVSPTFRVIAVPLYLLEEHDDSEIVSEVLANYRILKARTGGIA